MKTVLLHFLKDETGATAIEYGLIVAVLSLTIIGGIGQVSNSITWLFSDNNSRLANAFAHPDRDLSALADSDQCPSGPSSIVFSETLAEPGFSGFCCDASGAQPDIQTIEKLARIRPSGSENRSA